MPTEFRAETEHALLGEYWSRKNRGRSEQLSGGEAVTLVDCVGDNELATQVTIACEVEPIRPATDGDLPLSVSRTPPIVGVLEWGNDGATVSCEFDFVNGTHVSVPAGSIRLRARYETPPPEPFPVLVRAQIGYLPKPGAPATRTFAALIPGAGQAVFPVPKFARRARLVRSPQNAAALELFEPFAPTSIAIVTSADPELVLPIPNDARAAVISNNGAGEMRARLIFDLWL